MTVRNNKLRIKTSYWLPYESKVLSTLGAYNVSLHFEAPPPLPPEIIRIKYSAEMLLYAARIYFFFDMKGICS